MKFPSCFTRLLRFAAAAALVSAAQTFAQTPAPSGPLPVLERPVASERLPENWSDGDVFRLRAFAEPLVGEPGAASAEENAAFFAAINAFLLSGEAESLEGFLRQWPGSRWAAALGHNLGLIKYNAGFFTSAKESWKRSWELARGSKDPRMRALAHQSVAQLARMQARLGRIEELKPLLQEVNRREAGGSARQMLEASAEALHRMEKNPAGSFKCGPFALAEVREALGMPEAFAPAIRDIASPQQGFAL